VDRGFKQRYSNFKDSKFDDFKALKGSLKPSNTFEGTAIVYCWLKEEIDCVSRPCVNSCCPYTDVKDHNRQTCRSSVSFH